jgi:hypothetical protein
MSFTGQTVVMKVETSDVLTFKNKKSVFMYNMIQRFASNICCGELV